jgi:hypothetical protein
MPFMTPDILVQILHAIAQDGDLVASTAVDEYCDGHGIVRETAGAPNNNIFWNCDLAEAAGQHRVLKFKEAPTRNAKNWFALRGEHPRAPAPADGHVGRQRARGLGWVECVWLGTKWDWENAAVPPP